MRYLNALGSLRLTLVLLTLLLIAAVIVYMEWVAPTWALLLPVSALVVNLLAAIARQPAFRANPALMLFHLSLLAVVVFGVAGRLIYLDGRTALIEGGEFEGRLFAAERGPWHPGHIDRIRFVSESFTLDYRPLNDLPRAILQRARNDIVRIDDNGRTLHQSFGDTRPLVIDGYHFYTAPSNKGFAPSFSWRRPGSADLLLKELMLPPLPTFADNQTAEWTPPGLDAPLWVLLEFDETIPPVDRVSRFELPSEHALIVRFRDRRHPMQPGDRLELDGGELVYLGLRRWLGYDVRWDPTYPWFLAASALAVLSLIGYLVGRFRRPWQLPDPSPGA